MRLLCLWPQKKPKVRKDSFCVFFFFLLYWALQGPGKNFCNIVHKHHHLLMYCKSETAWLFGCLVMSEVSSFTERSNTGKCFSSENHADEKLLRAHPKFCLTPDPSYSFFWMNIQHVCCFFFFPLITTSKFVCTILMQRFYFDVMWETWKPHLGNLAGISVEI